MKIHVYPTKELEDSDVELLENNGQEREVAVEHTNKSAKYDSLAEFRNAATDGESRKKSSNLTAEVNEQLHHWCQFEAVLCCSEHI